MLKKVPNPIDRHVGSRLRMRRVLVGLSQEKLGDALKLTFQQIQKYEKGMNRIGASRLQEISGLLGVPVEFFFEGAPQNAMALEGNGILCVGLSRYKRRRSTEPRFCQDQGSQIAAPRCRIGDGYCRGRNGGIKPEIRNDRVR